MKRAVLTATACLLAAAALAAPAQAASEARDRSCAWILEPTADRENILFPEITTKYLAGVVVAPPGGYIEITGEYPHARYMSLQTYSHTLQSVSVLRDDQIQPDSGSSNPYVAGANRRASKRSYTVRIVHGSPPADGGPPNTLYDTTADGSKSGFGLAYRIYLPDRSKRPFGGVSAPHLALVTADGTRLPIPECPDPLIDPGLTQALAGLGISDLNLPALGLFAREHAVWRRYINAPTGYADILTDTDALGALEGPLSEITLNLPSGLGENADNKYVSTLLSREYGDVAVIRAKLPTTPSTYNGQRRMGRGQMRFWSMCSGGFGTQTFGCLTDEDIEADRRGRYTIAVSVAADRPANTTQGCGVGWIPWGVDLRTIMIMRNMLPSPGFHHAVQNAERGTERETLGAYYPRVKYLPTTAAFDSAYDC